MSIVHSLSAGKSSFTSRDMKEIFTGEASLDGMNQSFHPMKRFVGCYSLRPPDFVITYMWSTDFLVEIPRYFESLKMYVESDKFVHHGNKKSVFEDMTFWMDIFFLDQNSTDLMDVIAEEMNCLYAFTPHHAVFMKEGILGRGWCVIEIGYRRFSVMTEFNIDRKSLLRMLVRFDSEFVKHFDSLGDSMIYSDSKLFSNRSLKYWICDSIIYNKLPSMHFLGDMSSDLLKSRNVGVLDNITSFDSGDVSHIQNTLDMLFHDKYSTTLYMHAFADGAVHELKMLYLS
jgi:hypothetical protein